VETWFSGEDRGLNAVGRAGLWSLLAVILVLGTRSRLGHDSTADTSQPARGGQGP
jgi:hypothetical protein